MGLIEPSHDFSMKFGTANYLMGGRVLEFFYSLNVLQFSDGVKRAIRCNG